MVLYIYKSTYVTVTCIYPWFHCQFKIRLHLFTLIDLQYIITASNKPILNAQEAGRDPSSRETSAATRLNRTMIIKIYVWETGYFEGYMLYKRWFYVLIIPYCYNRLITPYKEILALRQKSEVNLRMILGNNQGHYKNIIWAIFIIYI